MENNDTFESVECIKQTGAQGSATPQKEEITGEALDKIVQGAKQAAAAAEEGRSAAATALADIQTKLIEIQEIARQVTAAKTQVTDEQAVTATKSAHIQDAQIHADKVRVDLDRALTQANQKATEAEGLQQRAQTASDNAAKILAEIRTVKGAGETDAAAIAAARKLAEESASITKSLADKSASVEQRLFNYETSLANLKTQCEQQLKTIESLLPGATSAGLAHAFDERRKTFLKPHGRWQILFVVSVLALVGLGATGLWQIHNIATAPTWNELVLLWFSRLPIAAALVWLAMHASRESALAKRLEEDYGFKSATASCFEGFRKQMTEVGTGALPDAPLTKLLANTLKTISEPPGKIYQDHKLTVSPTDELKEAAHTAATMVTAVAPVAKQI